MTRHPLRGFSLIETLVAVALVGIVASIGVPMTGNLLSSSRIVGDTRSLTNAITLAKMRAAASFQQARVYVDLSSSTYRIETRRAAGLAWVLDQGPTSLSTQVSFGFGNLASAPPNTQAAIAQSPACLTTAGAAIGNTACVVFNSRGIPIDSTGAPTGIDAVYANDGRAVDGVTVSATGLVRMWARSPNGSTWTRQ